MGVRLSRMRRNVCMVYNVRENESAPTPPHTRCRGQLKKMELINSIPELEQEMQLENLEQNELKDFELNSN